MILRIDHNAIYIKAPDISTWSGDRDQGAWRLWDHLARTLVCPLWKVFTPEDLGKAWEGH